MRVYTLALLPSLLVGVWVSASPVLQTRDITVTSTDLAAMVRTLHAHLSSSVDSGAINRIRNCHLTDSAVAKEYYAQYAAAGYCNSGTAVGDPITCSNDACPDFASSNATMLATFIGDSTDIEGFLSGDTANQLITLSFGGSSTIRNWLTDFFIVATESDVRSGCYIHAGFLTAWNEVSDNITTAMAAAAAAYPSYAMIATGHSLGAAVATIAIATLRETAGYTIDLWTYGSPRVGDEAFAEFVTNQTLGREYRVTHYDDPVPRLPPLLMGYRHTSPEYWLSDGTATTVNYTLSDIKVCTGTANTSCNAGMGGLVVEAHSYYFEKVTGCQGDVTSKRDEDASGNATASNEELEWRIDAFAQLDQQYVSALTAAGEL